MAEFNKAYFEWFESRLEDPGVYFGIATSLYRAFSDHWPILEIGCGRGYITHHLLSQFGPDHCIVGIDISSYAVANPLVKSLEGKLLCCDIANCRLPFGDGHFNCVFSWQLLEHMPDEDSVTRAIEEMSRVSGFLQLHSIRVLESGSGEDVTHTMMRSRDWWVSTFRKVGWVIDPGAQTRFEATGNWAESKEILVLRRR